MSLKLIKIIHSIQKLAFCYVIGQMLFFGAVFAPRVFRILERQDAAALQASIFPAYFLGGLIASTLILLSMLLLRRSKYLTYSKGRFYALTIMSLFTVTIFAYCYFSLNPELSELQQAAIQLPKDSSEPIAKEFRSLHHLSTRLNGVVLLLLILLLFFI